MPAKKNKTHYLCSECGESYAKWFGQCPACKAWNSLAEFREPASPSGKTQSEPTQPSRELHAAQNETSLTRLSTGWSDLDTVFGGGLMPGSVTLIGGEPGVGKSTLLLALAKHSNLQTCYITGEESVEQVMHRANRTGAANANLTLVQQNHLGTILNELEKRSPQLVFVDSIQTVYEQGARGFTGSISQIREAAQSFLEYAKRTGVPVVLTGHITKDGQIAGPKLLEHAVDVVLYFENHRSGMYRVLRATKNRYGSTGEICILEMTQKGLIQVKDSSALVSLSEIGGIGSVLFPQVEGSRVVPLEVQVLVTPTGFANGRRIGENIDISRIHLIAAILEKYSGYKLSQCDIFVRVNGGTDLSEQAGDLALLCAMASSYTEKKLPFRRAIAGEVALTGQVRSPGHLEMRRKAVQNWKLQTALWGGLPESIKTPANAESFIAHIGHNDLLLFGSGSGSNEK